MSPADPILFARDGETAKLTLNRPEVGNSIDLGMARALVAAAIRCDIDPTIRCVVLTGAGPMFCAGGDVGQLAKAPEQTPALLSELAGTHHMAVTRLARMAKPLVVVVNGPAAGAGFGLAVLGDVVLAGRSAHFTSAYTALGLTPDGGLSWLLPRLVGLRKAQEIILTNRRVSAGEAEAIGLVTRTVDDASLADDAAATAAALAGAATGALGAARALLLDGAIDGFETLLEREVRTIATASRSAEAREGIASFISKRKPNFKGN